MADNIQDVRWQQRFSNFQKALNQLTKYVEKAELSELEKPGLIKSFEFTYELAWNTLKDYLKYQGFTDIVGSRDTIRKSYENNLIKDGEGWMSMLKSRNETSHTYNQKIADEISADIVNIYFFLFENLNVKLNSLVSD